MSHDRQTTTFTKHGPVTVYHDRGYTEGPEILTLRQRVSETLSRFWHRLVGQRPKPVVSVAILIVARNNGRYLSEAIESALRQTVSCEIVYYDDASTDNSVAIAEQYIDRGVSVLRTKVNLGVCEARNRALTAVHTDYVVYLDGDDRLSNNYVEKHLSVMSTGVPFVYGKAQRFGTETTKLSPPKIFSPTLWHGNYIVVSALIRRELLLAVGGWVHTDGTVHEDWHLFLRLSRLGTPQYSGAVLHYRKHETQRTQTSTTEHLSAIRQSLARIVVGIVYSGRLPIDVCLSPLAESIPRNRVAVVVLNASGQSLQLSDYGVFQSVKIVPWKVCGKLNREISEFLADAYTYIITHTTQEIIWFVEDDIVLSKENWNDMYASITSNDIHATGLQYVNRGLPTELVGDGKHIGTGCFMMWRYAAPVCIECKGDDYYAHDWWLCDYLASTGRPVKILDTICGHAKTATHILRHTGLPIKRCTMVTQAIADGGGPRITMELVMRSTHDWVVFLASGTTGQRVDLIEELEHSGVEVVCYGDIRLPHTTHFQSKREAINYVTAGRDTLVGWGPPVRDHDILTGFSGRTIAVAHGSCEHTRKLMQSALASGYREFIGVSDPATAVCPNDRLVLTIRNGVTADRLAVTSPISRQSSKVAAYIGRRTPDKNPLVIADAVDYLPKEWSILMAGDGLLLPVNRQRVRLCPDRVDVGNVYASVDVVVMASPSEGCSLTVLEAWYLGIPVVSTRVGIIPELEAILGPMVFPLPQNPTPRQIAKTIQEAHTGDVTERAKNWTRQYGMVDRMIQEWDGYLSWEGRAVVQYCHSGMSDWQSMPD